MFVITAYFESELAVESLGTRKYFAATMVLYIMLMQVGTLFILKKIKVWVYS